jgi:hypothetical protein
MFRPLRSLCGVMLAVVALSTGHIARASVIFGLDTSLNGAFPTKVNNALPALTATFTDAGADTVTLTLNATNLLAEEFIPFWLFNYNGNPIADDLTASTNPPGELFGTVLSVPQNLSGGNQVKGGLFNVLFQFNTNNAANRFNGGESIVLTLTTTPGSGLFETDFLAFSIDKPSPNPSAGGWYSAAEIRGIPDDGDETTSGSIGTKGTLNLVPEPSSMALLLIGGFALAGFSLRNRRRVARSCGTEICRTQISPS